MMTYKEKTCEEAKIERYNFRFDPDGYAIVNIDEELGVITMYTDWGNFGNHWPKNGRGTETLKEFLVKIQTDYLLDKFCQQTYFDVKLMRAEMLRMYSEVEPYDLDRKDRKAIAEEIKEFSPDDISQAFFMIDGHCPVFYDKVMGKDAGKTPAWNEYQPAHVFFFEKIFPMIQAKLKEQIP